MGIFSINRRNGETLPNHFFSFSVRFLQKIFQIGNGGSRFLVFNNFFRFEPRKGDRTVLVS